MFKKSVKSTIELIDVWNACDFTRVNTCSLLSKHGNYVYHLAYACEILRKYVRHYELTNANLVDYKYIIPNMRLLCDWDHQTLMQNIANLKPMVCRSYMRQVQELLDNVMHSYIDSWSLCGATFVAIASGYARICDSVTDRADYALAYLIGHAIVDLINTDCMNTCIPLLENERLTSEKLFDMQREFFKACSSAQSYKVWIAVNNNGYTQIDYDEVIE